MWNRRLKEKKAELLRMLKADFPAIQHYYNDRQILEIVSEFPELAKIKYQIWGRGSVRLHPLLAVCTFQPSLEVVERIHRAYPQAISTKTKSGKLPLHWACQNGASLDVIQYLVSNYPNGARSMSDTRLLPLHLASCNNGISLESIQYLVSCYPYSVQAMDAEGMMPLHIACTSGSSLEVVQLLIAMFPFGVKISARNGNLPLDLARLGGDAQVIELLELATANIDMLVSQDRLTAFVLESKWQMEDAGESLVGETTMATVTARTELHRELEQGRKQLRLFGNILFFQRGIDVPSFQKMRMRLPRTEAELELEISSLNAVLSGTDTSAPPDAAEKTSLQDKLGLLKALRGVLPSSEKLNDIIQKMEIKKKALLKVQRAAFEIEGRRSTHSSARPPDNLAASQEKTSVKIPETRVELEMEISRLENLLKAASHSKDHEVLKEAVATEDTRNRLEGYRQVLPSADELRVVIRELDQAMEELGTSNFTKRIELLKQQEVTAEKLRREEDLFRMLGVHPPAVDPQGENHDGEEEEDNNDSNSDDDSTVVLEESDDDAITDGERAIGEEKEDEEDEEPYHS